MSGLYRMIAVGALSALLMGMLPGVAAAQGGERQCFTQTNQCIEGRFLEYWRAHGGLPVFGYPVTAARNEVNRDTGKTYLTQWFERNRFELHPENARPYDVLLGRLGEDNLIKMGRDWRKEYRAERPEDADCEQRTTDGRVFLLCGPMRTYYKTHGLEFDGREGVSEAESLALFGLPLTQAKMETNSSGDTVLTQWFERARMEFHPTKPEPFKLLLGLLGNEARTAAAQGRIIFSSDRDGDLEIYGLNMAAGMTTQPIRLTKARGQDMAPAASPDGTQIAFVSERDGTFEIYVMNADGSNQHRLTRNDAAEMNPGWSPDGKKIVFQSERDGNSEIYVMNADGSDQRRLTNHRERDFDPAWSPDGKRILWASYRASTVDKPAANDLYVMNADGSNIVRLTKDLARSLFPTWSPDGKRIAFQYFDGAGIVDGDLGGGAIAVMNADGTGQNVLASAAAIGGAMPSWSPDGTRIVFAVLRPSGYTFDLFVMNADGSGVTALTTGASNDAEPSWSR